MAGTKKLVGENYSTPDLRAKVTGRSKYAEDFRAQGMLFTRLLLSPYAHARVKSIDASAALAMPGVKAILTADEVPGPKDQVNDAGQVIKANLKSEMALTNEPLYQGEPVLAVAAIDELTAAEAIEKIRIRWEPLPFSVDPVASLLPGAKNPRVEGNVWIRPVGAPGQPPPLPEVQDLKWTEAEAAEYRAGRLPTSKATDPEWSLRRPRGRLQEGGARARRNVRHPEHQSSVPRESQLDGVLAERQALHPLVDTERRADGHVGRPLVDSQAGRHRAHQRVPRRRLWQQGRRGR